jgi:uncharacterized protein (DUF433 family)
LRSWQCFTDSNPIPLAEDEFGVIRVAGTRVTLDSIVHGFLEGETAEQIAQNYDSVPLADIYRIIGFYLANRPSIDSYLERADAESAAVRAENERKFPAAGIRDRLLARRQESLSSPPPSTK